MRCASRLGLAVQAAFAVAALGLAPGLAARTVGLAPPPGGVVNIQTPSGNILCMAEMTQVGDGPRPSASLVCERFEPEPIMASPDFTGASYFRPRHPLNAPTRPVYSLHYGDRWVCGSFSCLSERSGLTCQDRSGGHFVLNKQLDAARFPVN